MYFFIKVYILNYILLYILLKLLYGIHFTGCTTRHVYIFVYFDSKARCDLKTQYQRISRCLLMNISHYFLDDFSQFFKIFHDFSWFFVTFQDFTSGFLQFFKIFHEFSRFFMILRDFSSFYFMVFTIFHIISRYFTITHADHLYICKKSMSRAFLAKSPRAF